MREGRISQSKQTGERYRSFEQWERDGIINNLVSKLSECNKEIQERMAEHLTKCDAEYGRRAAEGLGIKVESAASESVGAD